MESKVMASKVSPAGHEQGSKKATTGVEIENVLDVKEESRASSICRIEETKDCCSGSVFNEAEVDQSESGIWMEVKNARVHFSWGDFFYALFLGLGPTVCGILNILIINL